MENNPNINIEQENQIKGQNKEINFEEKKNICTPGNDNQIIGKEYEGGEQGQEIEDQVEGQIKCERR